MTSKRPLYGINLNTPEQERLIRELEQVAPWVDKEVNKSYGSGDHILARVAMMYIAKRLQGLLIKNDPELTNVLPAFFNILNISWEGGNPDLQEMIESDFLDVIGNNSHSAAMVTPYLNHEQAALLTQVVANNFRR